MLQSTSIVGAVVHRYLASLSALAALSCSPLRPGDLQHGIGTDWKWKTGVEAQVAGPYQPCGTVGTGRLSWAAASPTGAEIALASRAGLVLFFALDGSKQIRAPFDMGGPVASVDYSKDGRLLVVAGDVGVKVVNLADGSVMSSNKPFVYQTLAAALSPDGSLLATLGWDAAPPGFPQAKILRMIRVADGTVVSTLPSVDAQDTVAPQFSSDGTFVVAGWQILSVPDLRSLSVAPNASDGKSALSPDGTLFAQSGYVWDRASGRQLKAPGALFLLWVAFSPDGATYAESYTETSGTTIQLFRTSDWSPTAKGAVDFRQSGYDTTDGRFFFSGDGQRLITTLSSQYSSASDLPVFQVWNVPAFTALATIAEPRLFWAGPAAFSPDGSIVAARLQTSSGLWNDPGLSPLSRITDASQRYQFLGNGLVALDSDGLYDPSDGQEVGRAPILWVEISPDGTLAVALTSLTQYAIVRLADLKVTALLDGVSNDATNVWAFSRDNRFLADAASSSSGNPTLTVFDVATGKMLTSVAGGTPMALSAAAADGSARLIGGAAGASTLRVWSVPDGTPLFDLDSAPAVDVSPEGSLIATGGAGTIRIFHADTGVMREEFVAHGEAGDATRQGSGVSSVAFSPTGQLASVGVDETMRLWCSP